MDDKNIKIKKLILNISIFFLVWFLRVLIFNSFDKNLPPNLQVASTFVFRLAIWVIPVFIYLTFNDKVNSLTYLKLFTSPVKTFWGVLSVVLAGSIWQIILILIGWDNLPNSTWQNFVNAILTPAIFEEILMRGFLFNKCREITSFHWANLITSIVFVAIHWPGSIIINGLTFFELFSLSIFIFILSYILGYLVEKTNSLWPSIMLHFINNFISQ